MLRKIIPEVKKRLESGYYEIKGKRKGKYISLTEALKKRGSKIPIIAEVKPISPAEGRLIHRNPVETAEKLVKGGAVALSILTEPKYFGGSLATLIEAKKFNIPLIMKDFVIDYKQIDAGSKAADCILLIMKLMDMEGININEFIGYAHKKGLEVILEIHSLEEFKRAKRTQADMIGINNRNLESLEVNINTTISILTSEKKDRLVISESGINNKNIKRLIEAGADGFLVGTSILKKRNIEKALAELVGG